MQLLTPAFLLAKINGRENVERDDIEDINDLFHDAKRSAQTLREGGDKFLH